MFSITYLPKLVKSTMWQTRRYRNSLLHIRIVVMWFSTIGKSYLSMIRPYSFWSSAGIFQQSVIYEIIADVKTLSKSNVVTSIWLIARSLSFCIRDSLFWSLRDFSLHNDDSSLQISPMIRIISFHLSDFPRNLPLFNDTVPHIFLFWLFTKFQKVNDLKQEIVL